MCNRGNEIVQYYYAYITVDGIVFVFRASYVVVVVYCGGGGSYDHLFPTSL